MKRKTAIERPNRIGSRRSSRRTMNLSTAALQSSAGSAGRARRLASPPTLRVCGRCRYSPMLTVWNSSDCVGLVL
jgi:hypothetical protein